MCLPFARGCFFGHPQGMPLRHLYSVICTLSGGHAGTAPTVLFSFGHPQGMPLRHLYSVLFRADTPVPPLRCCSLSGTHKGCPYGICTLLSLGHNNKTTLNQEPYKITASASLGTCRYFLFQAIITSTDLLHTPSLLHRGGRA